MAITHISDDDLHSSIDTNNAEYMEDLEILEAIPKLSKDNFGIWKVEIEKYLRREKLWGLVDETVPTPPYGDLNFWNARVRSIIKRTCGAWVLPFIEGRGKACSIWSQLEIMFKSAGETLRTSGTVTNYTWWMPLYSAIVNGDLTTVVQLVSKNKSVLTARLTSEGDIPLHVAVQHEQVKIVQEMVEMMEPNELAISGKYRRPALHMAVSVGNLDIVKVLVKQNEDLVMLISDYYEGDIPVTVAARAGNKDVVYYLYPITLQHDRLDCPPEAEKAKNVIRAGLLTCLILGDFFDLASHLLETHPNLVLVKDRRGETALGALSRKASAFPSSIPITKSSRGFGILRNYIVNTIYSSLDVDDEHDNLWRQITRDVENSSNASHDNPQGRDGIAVRFHKVLPLWFHRLYAILLLKLVPCWKMTIYDMKLKHHRAAKLLQKIWNKIIYEIEDLNSDNNYDEVLGAIFRASELGITEFLDEVIYSCPHLLHFYPMSSEVDEVGRRPGGPTLFHHAISNRQGRIFNRIHELGAMKNDIIMLVEESNKNSMLHLAAKLAPVRCLNQVPGAALQVQHELRWYKEVASIMPPYYEDFENADGKTAKILFTEAHKELVNEAAVWMKDTATQCMVVATLVTTIMFAAVFTVPGTTKDRGTGKPSYIHENFSIVFVSANILALCSSVASMLMFLAIATSRYAEEDFLNRLPWMLIGGLVFLFISIAGMMIEFVVAVLGLVHYDVVWVSFPIVFLAGVTITVCAFMEFPLFIELAFANTRAEVFGVRKQSRLTASKSNASVFIR